MEEPGAITLHYYNHIPTYHMEEPGLGLGLGLGLTPISSAHRHDYGATSKGLINKQGCYPGIQCRRDSCRAMLPCIERTSLYYCHWENAIIPNQRGN